MRQAGIEIRTEMRKQADDTAERFGEYHLQSRVRRLKTAGHVVQLAPCLADRVGRCRARLLSYAA